MKAKNFLLVFLPLLAAAASVVAPTAAQAEVCFQNTEGGPCITQAEGLVAKSETPSILVFEAGVTVTCTGVILEGKAKTKGASSFTKSEFTGCTVSNVKGGACTAAVKQNSEWTDQLGGSVAAGFKDTIAIPEPEPPELVINFAGTTCPLVKETAIGGVFSGSWTNDNPSTLAFTKAKGLKFAKEEVTYTGTFNMTRASGQDIFVSEH